MLLQRRGVAARGAARGPLRRLLVVAMARPWRPEPDDVDRLSRGDGAKRRGTGNFNIPHRLNADERPVYEAAKKKGFLAVRGTGYRKARRGNPLPNVFRQWCDAKASACVLIEQDTSGGARDCVVVDLAPLRTPDPSAAAALVRAAAAAAGARPLPPAERPLEAVPFNTIPVDLPQPVQQLLWPGAGAPAAPASPPPTPEQLAAAEEAVLLQGDAVRALKAAGADNSRPEVQQQVQELLRLKAALAALLDAAAAAEAGAASGSDGAGTSSSSGSSSGSSGDGAEAGAAAGDPGGEAGDGPALGGRRRGASLPDDHPFALAAIWQLPVLPLFFEADRPVAKDLAKELSRQLAGAGAR
ncbi:hypothetical protein HT031_001095 [Scenedesmus sp. PABB004]|nr:hypothetical protein HT031_001095 [Scenedesmus sp. PABB004]